MKRKFLSVLIALVLMLSFSLVTALPAEAAIINVPADYTTIGAAITAANPGDTITVDAATYAENVVIDKALTLQGATGATIAPTAGIAVEIQASTVTVDGFTITPLDTTPQIAQGIAIVASGAYSGVTLSNNTITTVAEGNHGIYVSMSSTGLTVTDNTITVGGLATAIYADGGQSLSAKNSGWTISGNTLSAAAGVNMELYDVDAVTIDNNTFMNTLGSNVIISSELYNLTGPIVFTNNDVQGNDGGSMVAFLRDFQAVDATVTTVADVTITGNTFDGWATRGLRIGDGVTTVTVNRNLFMKMGSATALKWENTAAVVLDAQYNWWGGVAGPDHAKNPYQTEANNQTNGLVDPATNLVDYTPWMIHDTLVAGWNIWSTPLAPATGASGEPDTNTIAEALDLLTADSTKVTDAYYFDSSTQAWAVATTLTPLQAVYLKLSSAATIDVVVSGSNYAPPGRTMHLGWNLVGTADWDDYKLVDAALLAALWGTGQVNLIGYQYVMSPSMNQATWSYTRDVTTATNEWFVPTEGYWVYMVNQGILNGFTYTPVTQLP